MGDCAPVPARAPRALRLALALVAALGPAAIARSQDGTDIVRVHGFATIAYGKTNDNHYSVGDPQGDYDNGLLAIMVTSQPTDRLNLVTKFALEQSEGALATELDYAFAEWRFSDAVRLRVGRVKPPFGLYAEIFDVGTLRPFVTLPQGIYGPAGFVSEGFDGVSMTGRIAVDKHGWALAYDACVGSIRFSAGERAVDPLSIGAVAIEAERVRDVIGGRFNIETPYRGLVVGASAYTGMEDSGRHTAVALHAEYLSDPWSLRSEFAHLEEDRGVSSNAFYVEAARMLGKWQAAARYDRSDTAPGVSGLADPFRRHRDSSVGVNYWFAPAFVMKMSYHHVDGNRFAHPEGADLVDAIRDGRITQRTDMVVIGVQFSF